MTTYTDDFNRADNTNIATGGLAWVESSGNLEIASNAVKSLTTNATAFATLNQDLGDASHYAEVTIASASTTNSVSAAGPFCRKSGTSSTRTYYAARINGALDTLTIYRFVSGSGTLLLSEAVTGLTKPFELRIAAQGTGATVVVTATLDGTDYEVSDSSGSRLTSGNYVGFETYSNGSSYMVMDNFEGSVIPEVTASEDGPVLQSAEILDTSRSDTAQAGGASTITLDSGASSTDNFYKGCRVYISSGTGSGQFNRIASYVGSTKVATVESSWSTQPDNTSVFDISSGNHLSLTFDIEATYNLGLATVNATPVVGQSVARKIYTIAGSSGVVRGNGTTTVVMLLQGAEEGLKGLGTPVNKGETGVTVDLPDALFGNSTDGNQSSTGGSVTNNSANVARGTCKLRGPIPMKIYDDTIDIEAEAFSPFANANEGVSSIAYTVSDGSNPNVTGSLTRGQTSNFGTWKNWKAAGVDISSLDDGALTVTVTATYDWTSETRSDSDTIYNNNNSGLDSQLATYYVDGSSGSDSNDGTTGNPFETIGKALDALRAASGVNGGNVYVKTAGQYDIQDGYGVTSWSPTLPITITKDPAGSLTDTEVELIDDGTNNAGLIKVQFSSGFLVFQNLKINVNSGDVDGEVARISNAHVCDNVTVTHDGIVSPEIGSISTWNPTSNSFFYNSTVDKALKGPNGYSRVVNCSISEIASDAILNCKYVSDVRVDKRSYGVPGFSVEYTGGGASATIELTDDVYTLKVDAGTVGTFDVSDSSYDSVAELVSAIDALAGWSATDLVAADATKQQDSKTVSWDFSAVECKNTERTIWLNTGDHSDLLQMHTGPYENIILHGLRISGSFSDTLGLSSVQQVIWLDHAGPLQIDGLAIVNCGDVTWATDGGTRSGIHNYLRDVLIGFNSFPDNKVHLVYQGGGTALSQFSPTNFVFTGNHVWRLVSEGDGTGADCFIVDNHYTTTASIEGDDFTDNSAITNEVTTYSRPNIDLTPKAGSDLLTRTAVTVPIVDATGFIRATKDIGAYAAAGSATTPTVTTATPTSETSSGATVGGNVTDDGGATVTSRGVYWALTSNPTSGDNVETAGAGGTGAYTVSITGVDPETTVYVKAWATNSAGTATGSEVEFTTLAEGGGSDGGLKRALAQPLARALGGSLAR